MEKVALNKTVISARLGWEKGEKGKKVETYITF